MIFFGESAKWAATTMPIGRSLCYHPLKWWPCASQECPFQQEWTSSSHTSCASCTLSPLRLTSTVFFAPLWQSWFPVSSTTRGPLEDNLRCSEASRNYNCIEVPMFFAQNTFNKCHIQSLLSNVHPSISRVCRRLRHEDARHTGGAPLYFHSSPQPCLVTGMLQSYDSYVFEATGSGSKPQVARCCLKWFVDVKDEALIDACGVNDRSMECIPAVRAHDVLRLWEHRCSSETARWKILLGRTGARVE